MAETTWTEEGTEGPRKKRIPTWAWFCGGGCLLAILIAVVVGGLGFQAAKKMVDPEEQGKRLALVLPHDPLPPDLKLMFGHQLGVEQYTFQNDARGYQLQVQNFEGEDGTEAREQMFGKEKPEFPENLLVMKFQDITPGTVAVQGRDLRLIRMRAEFSGLLAKWMPAEAKNQLGYMAFIDATPPGRDGMLFLQITRTRDQKPISDEDIAEILQPFHIGPDR